MPVSGYDREPIVSVSVTKACWVGVKMTGNEADPGESEAGQFANDPRVNGGCENTAATIAGVANDTTSAETFWTVMVTV